MEFIESLKLKEKLSPFKNHDIAWFYLFLPALILYFSMLMSYINEKPVIGSVEVIDSEFSRKFLPSFTKVEEIASGLLKSSAPLWIDDDNLGFLLFSDSSANRVYKWEEGKGFFTVGKSVFIKESGCKDDSECETLVYRGISDLIKHTSSSPVPTLDFLACQQGDRRIALIKENGTQQAIVTHFKSRRLNSPQSFVRSPEGSLYFSDPQIGLERINGSFVASELPFQGIFMLKSKDLESAIQSGNASRETHLVARDMESPYGLAFSPDYSKLYVSNSDPVMPYWKVYDINDDGSGKLKNGRLFYNATDMLASASSSPSTSRALGITVDIYGNVYASGPGGVLVFSSEGVLLCRIHTSQQVTGLTIAPDGTLFLTMTSSVARLKLRTKPIRHLTSKSMFW